MLLVSYEKIYNYQKGHKYRMKTKKLDCDLRGLRRRPDVNLKIINWIFRNIFGQNKSVRWPVHYTSQVIGGQNIYAEIRETFRPGVFYDSKILKSFAQSGSCYYQAKNGIYIADGTLWGPGVRMISANHDPLNSSKHLPAPPIRIGYNCLIGAGAIILPGCEIGDNVIVGAGTVITKNVRDGATVVGNPAREIAWRSHQ